MDTTTPQAAPPPEKKSLFATVVATTPVLLAIIATFILGQSSSEMTKAQYQRSLASQNQAKVTNQWDFFQAKRSRGTTYEATANLLYAQGAEPFTKDNLLDAAKNLIDEIQLIEKDAGQMSNPAKALEKIKALRTRAELSLKQIGAALNPPIAAGNDHQTILTPDSVKSALDALHAFPRAKHETNADADDGIDAEQRKILVEIIKDLRAFKPEKEIASRTLELKTDTLDKAMERAKANAAKTAERGKAIDRVLEEFDALVDGHAELAREYQQIMRPYLARIKAKGKVEDAEKLDVRINQVRTASANLLAYYKAARYRFDARRYEDDARSNQEAAYLYDIHVLQSSARSDRHLGRSFGFMIAMLVAQVSVTIGTLALAMKWRLPTWVIAVLAGLSAIALGVYIFLEMGPLNF